MEKENDWKSLVDTINRRLPIDVPILALSQMKIDLGDCPKALMGATILEEHPVHEYGREIEKMPARSLVLAYVGDSDEAYTALLAGGRPFFFLMCSCMTDAQYDRIGVAQHLGKIFMTYNTVMGGCRVSCGAPEFEKILRGIRRPQIDY